MSQEGLTCPPDILHTLPAVPSMLPKELDVFADKFGMRKSGWKGLWNRQHLLLHQVAKESIQCRSPIHGTALAHIELTDEWQDPTRQFRHIAHTAPVKELAKAQETVGVDGQGALLEPL